MQKNLVDILLVDNVDFSRVKKLGGSSLEVRLEDWNRRYPADQTSFDSLRDMAKRAKRFPTDNVITIGSLVSRYVYLPSTHASTRLVSFDTIGSII